MLKLKEPDIAELPAMLIRRESADLNIAIDISRLRDVRKLIRTVWQNAASGDPDVSEDRSQLQKMELATTELISNIIRYSFPEAKSHSGGAVGAALPTSGQIRIEAVVNSDGQLIVHVSHNGLPFDVDLSTVEQLEEPQEGGMGLFLISRCVDQLIHACPGPGHNLFWLINHPVTK